jgi:glycosyltransferase involved in cell wall biosynthesis
MDIYKTALLPRVSIIIPVYNLELLVSKCIESCLIQTCIDIEIIVVNDGSTDGSAAVIDSYCKADRRIKHIKKQNEGLPFARRTGVANAAGTFLFHLDGDDTIPRDAIEKLLNQACTDNADIVAGNVLEYRDGKVFQESSYSHFGTGTGIAFLEYILANQLHYACGKLIKRALWTEHEIEILQEVALGEDQMLLYQLCMFANKVSTVHAIVYEYRINDASITKRPIANEHFTRRQEYFAHMLFGLICRFNYNPIIRQQINLRILKALYLGLHRTGHYVVNGVQSRQVMKKTLGDSVFSKQSLLIKNPALIARCFTSLLYPKFAFKLSKTFS